MPKRWAVLSLLALLFLSPRAFAAITNDCQLTRNAELIVRAKVYFQTRKIRNPSLSKDVQVPLRLEILHIYKKSLHAPKIAEVMDNYYVELDPKWDSAAWVKACQAWDGKEVLAFLSWMASPDGSPHQEMFYLPPSDLTKPLAGPSPGALRLYSASAAQTIEDCLRTNANPPEAPVPDWAVKALSKMDFSFINTAVHRRDNDMDITGPSREGEQVKIPLKVQAVLQSAAKADLKDIVQLIADDDQNGSFSNWHFTEKDIPDPRKTYGPVYLVKAPNGLEVYGMMDLKTLGGWSYGFVLYDPKTDRAGADMDWISGRWLDDRDLEEAVPGGHHLLERPFVSFDDLYSDGRTALVVEEREHNGTIVNGAAYNYFCMEPDLSLKEVLTFEPRLLNFSHTQYWFLRKITARKRNELTVTITMESEGEAPQPVGTVILRSKGGDKPFRVIHKVVKNKRYDYYVAPWNDPYSP
jgi:hypothetical protein